MEQYKLRYHATFNRLYSHSDVERYFEVDLKELPNEVIAASELYITAYKKYDRVDRQRGAMWDNEERLHAAYMSNNDDPMQAKAKWMRAKKARIKHCKCC